MGSCCSKKDEIYHEALFSRENLLHENNDQEYLVLNPYTDTCPTEFEINNNQNIRRYTSSRRDKEPSILYEII